MFNSKACQHCGCIPRKVIPIFIVINGNVIWPDKSDPDESGYIWVCPNCQTQNR